MQIIDRTDHFTFPSLHCPNLPHLSLSCLILSNLTLSYLTSPHFELSMNLVSCSSVPLTGKIESSIDMEYITATMLQSFGTPEAPENWVFDEIQLGLEAPVRRDEFLLQVVQRANFQRSHEDDEVATAAAASVSDERKQSILIDHIVSDFVVPTICVFGLIGNILNLVVLTREQLRCSLKPMERSVNTGFVALALSDVLFCLFYLFDLFTHKKPTDGVYASMFKVYYKTYKEPILNIFLLSSTWLTVVMAVGRYVAVCRPIQARGFINPRGTQIAIGLVFSGSVFVNMPRFWHYYVDERPCLGIPWPRNDTAVGLCSPYVKMAGSLYLNRTFRIAYNIVLSTVGIFIPFVVLIVCNLCLIRALRRSYAMQKRYRGNHAKDSGQRITPTLITLIVLFVILVGPSEMLTFLDQGNLSRQNSLSYYRFRIAAVVTNCLLLLNFAINVVLYCILNTQFRRVMKSLFCVVVRKRRSIFKMSAITRHHTTTSRATELDLELTDGQWEPQTRLQATTCIDYIQQLNTANGVTQAII